MSLITATEAKTLLQIFGTTYDTLIAALIPVVRREIIDITNNRFLNPYVCLSSGSISFAAATTGPPAVGPTITDSQGSFLLYHFNSGMDICVSGSIKNDGYYETTTIAAGTITLATTETLTDEASGLSAPLIQQMVFPTDLKMIAARMIAFQMDKWQLSGESSRSISDLSISYAGGGYYPAALSKELYRWRKL
jgi:hypothetical protein